MHLIELAIIFREVFDFVQRLRSVQHVGFDATFDVTNNQWVCGPTIQIDSFFNYLNTDCYDTDDTDDTDDTVDTSDLPALVPDPDDPWGSGIESWYPY